MAVTTLSSRAFNQDTSKAKKAAQNGPVFITDRGKPAHVLLTIAEYHRLAGQQTSLFEAIAQTGVDDFEFDPPRLSDVIVEPADLS